MSIKYIHGMAQAINYSMKIIVRVIRLWEVPNYINSDVIDSTKLVLIHKQWVNDTSKYTKKTIMQRFSNMAKEGSCHIIIKFGVVSNICKHRATNHSYKINFFKRLLQESVKVYNSLYMDQILHHSTKS
ncbi:tRNA-specific 2-thiouridylase MnmA [Bienertia sinuspersici]